jgi:RNA polymerase sigma factor (sigma-70 family)
MDESKRTTVSRWIRRMTHEVSGASDAQLLDRFAVNRDEAAFELLLWRHAWLVFGVCPRVLHNWHDAEDAFQATFLALARRAGRIAKQEAVPAWLHKVAYRVALTAQARRDANEKRRRVDRQIPASPGVEAALEAQELRSILDQEIGRLPERFRAAVVLCYLEGKSVDEAALLLDCPRGTVASRLARARAYLRSRLAGRGLVLTAALAISSRAGAVPGPLSLIPTLTAAALCYTASGAVAEIGVPPRVTSLTEEVLRAMFLHKLKTGIGLVAAAISILLAGGGLAVGLHAMGAQQAQTPSPGEGSKKPAENGKGHGEDEPIGQAPRPVIVGPPVRREALRAVEVRPAVSGVVDKVCFKAGAEIKKGEVLFELDPRAAQLALGKAQAEMMAAEGRKRLSAVEIQRV